MLSPPYCFSSDWFAFDCCQWHCNFLPTPAKTNRLWFDNNMNFLIRYILTYIYTKYTNEPNIFMQMLVALKAWQKAHAPKSSVEMKHAMKNTCNVVMNAAKCILVGQIKCVASYGIVVMRNAKSPAHNWWQWMVQAGSPGARPTKHISIEFEIRWKFKTL